LRTPHAPLAHPSCNPPQQASSFLTVGTPDANGQPANAIGSVLMNVLSPNADVRLDVSITDVRNKSDLSDYTGELQADAPLRITDKDNAPTGVVAATVSDTHFPFTVLCATTDPTIGSTCSVSTSANALVPGSVTAGKRAIWELGQVKVLRRRREWRGRICGCDALHGRGGIRSIRRLVRVAVTG
jgi:hypothetical protein